MGIRIIFKGLHLVSVSRLAHVEVVVFRIGGVFVPEVRVVAVDSTDVLSPEVLIEEVEIHVSVHEHFFIEELVFARGERGLYFWISLENSWSFFTVW